MGESLRIHPDGAKRRLSQPLALSERSRSDCWERRESAPTPREAVDSAPRHKLLNRCRFTAGQRTYFCPKVTVQRTGTLGEQLLRPLASDLFAIDATYRIFHGKGMSASEIKALI